MDFPRKSLLDNIINSLFFQAVDDTDDIREQREEKAAYDANSGEKVGTLVDKKASCEVAVEKQRQHKWQPVEDENVTCADFARAHISQCSYMPAEDAPDVNP